MSKDAPFEKINLHSHITGLGIEGDQVLQSSDGVVGQTKARMALNVVRKLIANGYNNPVVLTGESGTGKSALAFALGREMDCTSSTLNVCELKKKGRSIGECLLQAARRSITIAIKETYEIVEGEVVEIESEVGRIRLVLKTTDMESMFEIGEKMFVEMKKERVEAGDVIRLNKSTGKFRKVGKSLLRAKNTYPDANMVPCPEGELIKSVEEINTATLHDIDMVNSKFNPLEEAPEIKAEVREDVNKKIKDMVNEGKATVGNGMLVIDEMHLLDKTDLIHFNKLVEQDWAPLILIITEKLENLDWPRDLLDRVLIVKTSRYEESDLREIARIKSEEEGTKTSEEVLTSLVAIGSRCGLKYMLSVLTLASVRATKRNANVSVDDVQRVYNLFLDPSRIQ